MSYEEQLVSDSRYALCLRVEHPGAILLRDFLLPRGLTPHALSLALHVSWIRVDQVIRGRRKVTADTALRLGRYFRNPAWWWMQLQTEWELSQIPPSKFRKVAREVMPFRDSEGDRE